MEREGLVAYFRANLGKYSQADLIESAKSQGWSSEMIASALSEVNSANVASAPESSDLGTELGALENISRDAASDPKPETPIEQREPIESPPPKRRWRLWLLLGLLVVFIIAIVLAVLWSLRGGPIQLLSQAMTKINPLEQPLKITTEITIEGDQTLDDFFRLPIDDLSVQSLKVTNEFHTDLTASVPRGLLLLSITSSEMAGEIFNFESRVIAEQTYFRADSDSEEIKKLAPPNLFGRWLAISSEETQELNQAQGLNITGLSTNQEFLQMQRDFIRSFTEIYRTNSFLVFKDRPQQVDRDGQRLMRYNLAVDADKTLAFVNQLAATAFPDWQDREKTLTENEDDIRRTIESFKENFEMAVYVDQEAQKFERLTIRFDLATTIAVEEGSPPPSPAYLIINVFVEPLPEGVDVRAPLDSDRLIDMLDELTSGFPGTVTGNEQETGGLDIITRDQVSTLRTLLANSFAFR